MTLKHHRVRNYEEYGPLFSELSQKKDPIITFFCGSLNSEGQSWCPDCNSALPVINAVVNTFDKDEGGDSRTSQYVFVNIDREQWKNENCEFRTRDDLKLSKIPTLTRWQNGSETCRLVEEECCDEKAVSSCFAL